MNKVTIYKRVKEAMERLDHVGYTDNYESAKRYAAETMQKLNSLIEDLESEEDE